MENKIFQLLRRLLFPLTLLSLLVAVPAQATLYQFYREQGKPLPSLAERSQLASTLGVRSYTGTASQNTLLEYYLRSNIEEDQTIGFGVATDYDTTLAQSMTSNQSYLVVSSLLTRDGQTVSLANLNASKVFLTIEPGASKEELVVCTGVSTTLNRFDGCTRGLAGIGTSTASVAANQKTHIAGSKVIMSNVHYVYNEYVDRDTAQTIDGLKTFTTIPRIPTSTPTDPSEVVSLATLASTSYSGTVNATDVQKGIVEIATDNEFVNGTATGATGAYLVATPAQQLTYRTTHLNSGITYGQTLVYGDVLFVSTTNSYLKALATDSSVVGKIAAVAYDSAATGTFSKVFFPGSLVYSGSNLTTGTPVYLSDTGGVSATAGTYKIPIGVALNNTAWIFNPISDFIPRSVTATESFIPIATASGTLQRGWVPFQYGGDCSDGALTISSGTTTINLGSASIFTKNYSSISITGTGVLLFSNPASSGTVINLKSCGNTTLTSSANPMIDLRSMGATGGSGGVAGTGTGGTNATNWIAGLVGGGNGGGAGGSTIYGAGGAGGSSASAAGTAGVSVGGGPSGGSAGSTAYFNVSSSPFILAYARPGAGGGGGGSGNNGGSNGGAGGRGAGSLYIETAGALNFTGVINAAGAAGTAGTVSGGIYYSGSGGGGGAGCIILGYGSLTAGSGTMTVSGGTGGAAGGAAGVGDGGAGASCYGAIIKNTSY